MFGYPSRKGSEDAAGGGSRRRRKLGVVLGAGAARGWAHIGVMQELMAHGVVPDIIVGSSIGAVVSGCFAAGGLDELERFTRSLTRRRVFGLMDVSFSGGGLIGGDRLRARLENTLKGVRIEDLPYRFAAVATEVGAGHEIWLTRGPLVDAMRASYALPGIFPPVQCGGRWLMDGALVNPVPVSVARALGADTVIAVNLNADTFSRGATIQDAYDPLFNRDGPGGETSADANPEVAPVTPARASRFGWPFTRSQSGAPGIGAVMVDAFNITQDRIARSRLAGDPPDVMIQVRAGKIGLFEFHRADELISLGRETARRAIAEIAEHVDLAPAIAV
jgi:NTE family protein